MGNRVKQTLLWLLSGILIGGGAILPGISGGVLCLVFGVYQPMMETLAHPKTGLRKHFAMLLPVAAGYVLGFLGFARVIAWVFGANDVLATWLFLGLICGMMPELFADSGKQGRTWKSWCGFAAGFLTLAALLLIVRLGILPRIAPGFGAFVFCGVLWGLSLVIPGMTSSSQLMALGLYLPLTDGIAAFDWSVLLPWGLGLVLTVLVCARAVNALFRRHYSVMYQTVSGVVAAPPLMLVPPQYAGAGELALSLVCGAAGFAAAWWMGRFSRRLQQDDRKDGR